MKLLAAVLLFFVLGNAEAQDRRVRVISPSGEGGEALEDLVNHQLELKINRRDREGSRFLLTTSSGQITADLLDPVSATAEGESEIPVTISLRLGLRPHPEKEGVLVAEVFLQRSIPYVSGQTRQGPEAVPRSIIQSRSMVLTTRVVLPPGEAVTLIDDGREVVTLELLDRSSGQE